LAYRIPDDAAHSLLVLGLDDLVERIVAALWPDGVASKLNPTSFSLLLIFLRVTR
jgi:hypothetical protein